MIEEDLFNQGIKYIPKLDTNPYKEHGKGIRPIKEFDFFKNLITYGKK